MTPINPKYEVLVSVWPTGKLGSIRTYQLSKDIKTKIFPDPKTSASDEMRTKFLQDAGIYSKPVLRNVRLYSFNASIRVPLLNFKNNPNIKF